MTSKKRKVKVRAHSKYAIDHFFEHGFYITKNGTGNIYLGSHVFEDYSGEENGIDFISSDKVIKSLLILNDVLPSENHIKFILNTPGGDIYHMAAIYDFMKEITDIDKRKILVLASGSCMSAGAYILQGGTERYSHAGCSFMIHYGYTSVAGEVKTVERQIEYEKILDKRYLEVMYECMKNKNKRITKNEVDKMCDRDTWFTAKEALKIGLIDYIVE